MDLALLLLALGRLPRFCLLAPPPFELVVDLGLELALEGLEFEGVLQALGVDAEVGLLQRVEGVMEELVLLASSLYLGHQSSPLLLCGFLRIFVQDLGQLPEQL